MTIAIIPARMASTRFPGKPLAEIYGIPMIGHVFLRSTFIESAESVHVATCDNIIFDYIKLGVPIIYEKQENLDILFTFFFTISI